MNWEFTGEEKNRLGVRLKRIRASRSFELKSGIEIIKGTLGGWIAGPSNLSENAWVYDEALVYGNALVCDDAVVYGNAVVKSSSDYSVYKNTWSSMRWFTYMRSNRKWLVGCFQGTGEELVRKAYKDSELSGKCYEAVVRCQQAIDAQMEAK